LANDTKGANARIIIHHLSDIHYGLDPNVGGQAALNAYLQPLLNGSMPLPDVLAITGDLTISGSPQELQAVHKALDPLAQVMKNSDRRVFVVPGPHDLFWVDTSFWSRRRERHNAQKNGEAVTNGRSVFYDLFRGPYFVAPYRSYELSGPNYHVALFDTCYRPMTNPPEKDAPEAEKLFNDYVKYHEEDGLGSQRLLTHMVAANSRDRGQCDGEAVESIKHGVMGAAATENQIRIMVTHHPLFACSVGQQSFQAPDGADSALQAARTRDVQLLLHGHVHQPNVITTSYGAIGGAPNATVVQVGGGTLAQVDTVVPSYNVIIAQRDALKQTESAPEARYWSVQIETIPFTTTASRSSSYFLLGHATEQLLKRTQDIGESDGELAKRRTIAYKTDGILREMAKLLKMRADLAESHFEDLQLRQLSRDMDIKLDSVMDTVGEMVRETVFAGTPISMGLLLKPHQALYIPVPEIDDSISLLSEEQPGVVFDEQGRPSGAFARPAPLPPAPPAPLSQKKMKYQYLFPNTDAGQEWRDGIPYISTMAGWSLILGKTLVHTVTHEPPDASGNAKTVDHIHAITNAAGDKTATIDLRWLHGTHRDETLELLKKYIQELTDNGAKNAGHPDNREYIRVEALATAIKNNDPSIALDTLFLAQTTGRNGKYTPFVSVPVPHRLNGFEDDMVELGVLQIDMEQVPEVGLTPSQSAMLSGIAHLVWIILATANAIEDYQNALHARIQHIDKFVEYQRRITDRYNALNVKYTQLRDKYEKFN
jgi:3',5'-cyclic AMP phosphodiesterase CpdA